MENQQLIETFYQSFASGDAEGMVSCYHDSIEFRDPVFGLLRGDEAKGMWRMLLKNRGIHVYAENISATPENGCALWTAEYTFSRTGRKVVNKVSAKFEFRDGKMIKHTDHFNYWKWASQALGLKGTLLGWTPFMQHLITGQAKSSLENFMRKQP